MKRLGKIYLPSLRWKHLYIAISCIFVCSDLRFRVIQTYIGSIIRAAKTIIIFYTAFITYEHSKMDPPSLTVLLLVPKNNLRPTEFIIFVCTIMELNWQCEAWFFFTWLTIGYSSLFQSFFSSVLYISTSPLSVIHSKNLSNQSNLRDTLFLYLIRLRSCVPNWE